MKNLVLVLLLNVVQCSSTATRNRLMIMLPSPYLTVGTLAPINIFLGGISSVVAFSPKKYWLVDAGCCQYQSLFLVGIHSTVDCNSAPPATTFRHEDNIIHTVMKIYSELAVYYDCSLFIYFFTSLVKLKLISNAKKTKYMIFTQLCTYYITWNPTGESDV